jgi:hypothetical protein
MSSKAKIRGRIVQKAAPPAQPADPLAWHINRLQTDDNGQPLMEGIFSNYNDDIVLEADENTLIGRAGPGRGPVQRFEIGDGLRVEDGVIIGEGGGEKGDPGPPGPAGPVGPQGPAGASSSMWLYRFDSGTSYTDPGAGRYRMNQSAPSTATKLYVDRLTQDGLDPTSVFTLATFDDEFIIQERGMAARHQKWKLLGPATIVGGDWFEVPVEFVSAQGAPFSNNNEVTFLLRTRGQPGPVGPAGPIGPVGPQGPQGFQGTKGDTGNTGPVGGQGPQGIQGPQGQQGVVGPKGDQGDQGIQGNTGATGAKGDKGDQGDLGPTGNTGATGPQGIQGPKGDPGSLGADEAPIDGKIYGRKNEAWAEVESGSSIFVNDAPPIGAPDNALWWDSDSGILYLRYNDGDSVQWVQAAATVGGGLPLEGGTLTGFLTLHADPTALLHASTKQYVDTKVAAVPAPVAAATTNEYIANSAPTKMLTGGAVWGAAAAVQITDGATITLNLSLGFDFSGGIGTGRTMANPINGKSGQKGTIFLNAGSITAWGNKWFFPSGVKPISSGGVDIISYVVGGDGTSMFCTANQDFK